MKSKYLVLYALLIVIGVFAHLFSTLDVPMTRPLTDFPATVNGWSMVKSNIFTESVLKVLSASDYLDRQYVNRAGQSVSIYVGYHSGGPGVGAIHSPKNCLPGSGWYELFSEGIPLDLDGKNIQAVYSVYRKSETDVVFVYWFELDGYAVDNEYSLKLAEIANSFTKRRRDSAFLRFTAPAGFDRDQTLALVKQFITDFYPVVQQFLPFKKVNAEG